ncbi:MAG: transglutaminase-like cysteine peptidase [Proteobacteria bacterium]|nr:transglutaminase-like cysteine peptidase [Pseudomonadota bacterium]
MDRRGMERRGFLAALGAGAVAGLAPIPSWAAVGVEDVSRSAGDFPSLFGTREYFIGSTVKKLPRARAAIKPLEREIAANFAQAVARAVPVSAVRGGTTDSIFQAAGAFSPHERMRMVNDFANRMPYIEDIDNYGLRDFWADTATFFKNGGDCEDFAMAKFKLLEKIGFHPARMRIVLLLDQNRNRQHAVLTVNTGGEAWMLDSLIRDVVPHQKAAHYRPTVSLSGPRLYLHIAPKA